MTVDGPGVSAIVDHAFVPDGAWYERCGFRYPEFRGAETTLPCGLAEAAHASTTVRREDRT